MRKLMDHHRRVLVELDEHTQPDGELCCHFKPLARWCEMEIREVRRITRHLARKGLAEYHRALFTEDGYLAGAGYCITPAGRAKLAEERG